MTDIPLIGPVAPPELHVMSFNIRRRMMVLRGPDRWFRRRPLVHRLLKAEQPTILGVQEALPDQAGFVRHALGESYRSVGHGRNANGRGEGCPIIYDGNRLELLDWTQTALSDRPFVPGSTSWGNPTPRIVVMATLRDHGTGIEFSVLNTHFDQFSRRSRMSSADEILRLVAQSPMQTVVTGDFNVDDQSIPHDQLTGPATPDGIPALVDSWFATRERVSESWGSFPNYHAPKLQSKRIDWILVSPSISVLRAGINVTRYDGNWPSDHAPVQAVLNLGTDPAL